MSCSPSPAVFVASLLLFACGDKEAAPDTGGQDASEVDTDGDDGSDTDGDTDPDTDAGTDADADTDTDTDTGGEPATGPAAGDLVEAAATAWCGAVLSCCDGDDQAWAFGPWLVDDRLSAYHSRMPPNATLDASSCAELVGEILPELWMGAWLEAHDAGLVTYDAAAAQTCLAQLSGAACGEPVRDALLDSTCFATAAPEGGASQRAIFQRESTSGACTPIADGFGGLYFGSCDPQRSFCCIDEGQGCDPFPVPGDAGACVAASQVGDACSDLAPIQLCATGLDCVDGVCEAPRAASLSLGEVCYDSATYTLLGECADGWCDLFGSGACEAPKAAGEGCWSDEECATGHCDIGTLTCGVNDICEG